MLHVLMVNPYYLVKCEDLDFRLRLRARRQRHARRYIPILESLSADYKASKALFDKTKTDENFDEDMAGEDAPFWTALIRTQKAGDGVSHDEVQNMIANALAKARA